MGSCCACCGKDDEGKDELAPGKDLSKGPLLERSCTDVFCIIVFAVHWVGFLVVMFMGFAGGDPRKLYRPRDYAGGFCGLDNHSEHAKLIYMMNTTEMVGPVVQSLVCSSASTSVLQTLSQQSNELFTNADLEEHMCNCCLTPCDRCAGSLGIADVSSTSGLNDAVSGNMGRLTDMSSAGIASPSDTLGKYDPQNIFTELTKYFIPVCYPKVCAFPDVNDEALHTREYIYVPDPDSPYRKAWDALSQAGPASLQTTLQTKFKFQALSEEKCPYDARYCVPTPGVNFTDAPNDYCLPKLDGSAAASMGQAATDVMNSIAESAVLETGVDSIGSLAGEIMNTVDVLVVVCFWSFMIGLIFMVLLRFFVGCFVWASLFLVGFFLILGGGVAVVRSGQCKGASLFDSGKQTVTAVAAVAEQAVSDQLSADPNQCFEGMVEDGDGSDYRGCQSRSKTGRLCQRWDTQGAPHNHVFMPSTFPDAHLTNNYCRNPKGASTIWCVTSDPAKPWEECSPIGVITAECKNGYAMGSQTARDVLRVFGYITWGLAVIWFFIVCCMYSRIRLAIAINQVAAKFIFNVPTVLLVPMVQISVAISYSLLWAISASFLLAQVPDGYTSKESYATYTEAMGNYTTPGECNPKWPAGFAYKTNVGDDCTVDAKCWRCAPPRWVFDQYFAYSFFSYLWNNALLVAMGQTIIAGAVGVWFFQKKADKGKPGTRTPAVMQSVKIALKYHLGSMAFGAFIIAVCQFIRYCLMYLEKQAAQQKNRVLVLVLKCLQCCMWCLEKFLKFINKNAYIQMALLGTNFCCSAKNAFFLISRNILRFGTMLILGSIIHFIGTSVIIAATAVSGYFLLQMLHPEASPVAPMIVYIAIAYVVAKLFMNVFGLAVDTSLQCFIIVEEQKLPQECVPGPLKNLVRRQNGEAVKGKAAQGSDSSKVVPSAES